MTGGGIPIGALHLAFTAIALVIGVGLGDVIVDAALTGVVAGGIGVIAPEG